MARFGSSDPIAARPVAAEMQKHPWTRYPRRGVFMAEDRGFEPLRAVNPTRIPSVRHRPLGESSAPNYTGHPGGHRPRRADVRVSTSGGDGDHTAGWMAVGTSKESDGRSGYRRIAAIARNFDAFRCRGTET